MAVVIGVFNVNEVSENLFGAFSDEYDVNEVIGVLNEEFDNDEVIAVLDDEWGIDDLISLLSDVEYNIADVTGPLTLDWWDDEVLSNVVGDTVEIVGFLGGKYDFDDVLWLFNDVEYGVVETMDEFTDDE